METDDESVNHVTIGYIYVDTVYKPYLEIPGTENADEEWTKKTFDINDFNETRKMEINELKSASVYAVAVKIKNSVGTSDWSNPVQVETREFQAVVVTNVGDYLTPGLTVTLQCTSRLGYALVDPIWSRSGEELKESRKYSFKDNLLMINEASEGDEGEYTCAVTEEGSTVTGTWSLLFPRGVKSSSSKDDGPAVGGGIAVAVIVGLCLIIALVWYCKSRSNKRKQKREEDSVQISAFKQHASETDGAASKARRQDSTNAKRDPQVTEVQKYKSPSHEKERLGSISNPTYSPMYHPQELQKDSSSSYTSPPRRTSPPPTSPTSPVSPKVPISTVV